MKSSNLFLKITVLSFFVLFLIGFVAYRSGALDNKWFSEKSPVTIDSPPARKPDTTVRVNPDTTEIKKMLMMSGSKSMPVIDREIPTTKNILRKDTPVIKADTPKPKRIIPSTKSGRLIYPRKS